MRHTGQGKFTDSGWPGVANQPPDDAAGVLLQLQGGGVADGHPGLAYAYGAKPCLGAADAQQPLAAAVSRFICGRHRGSDTGLYRYAELLALVGKPELAQATAEPPLTYSLFVA